MDPRAPLFTSARQTWTCPFPGGAGGVSGSSSREARNGQVVPGAADLWVIPGEGIEVHRLPRMAGCNVCGYRDARCPVGVIVVEQVGSGHSLVRNAVPHSRVDRKSTRLNSSHQ